MQALRNRLKSMLGPLVRSASPARVDLHESLWRLKRDPTGALSLNSVRLEGLLERWGSPLHVVDVARIDENVADFLAVPPGARAGCEPYYSYKTNPVPDVLSRLHALGVGAEVISAYELWLALKLGVPGDHIVYNGPGRCAQSLKLAIERGVLIHLNNREEIEVVDRLARQVGRKARVGIRVGTAASWTGQFGESISTGDAMRCFHEVKRKHHLELAALHCHQGKEIATEGQLRQLLGEVVAFLSQLRFELGVQPAIVDIGGGLASRTVSALEPRQQTLNRLFGSDLRPRGPDTVLTIRAYTAVTVAVIESACRAANIACPRIFVEPGRAMTGDTQLLLCRVINLKAGDPSHAVLDAGVNIAEPVKNRYHQLFTLASHGLRARKDYRLVGPICTPMDVLCPSWSFPELRRGDGLAIMDSGAYFVPFSTSFSFPQPAIVALEGTTERLLRRRETFDDMVDRDVAEERGEQQLTA